MTDLSSVPWRTGRSLGRTVYARTGGDDWKADTVIGMMDTRELAEEACRAHNDALALREVPTPMQAAWARDRATGEFDKTVPLVNGRAFRAAWRLWEAGRAYGQAEREGRAKPPAIALLEEALFLRVNGEYAPGGNENWHDWDDRAERFLRSLLPEPDAAP